MGITYKDTGVDYDVIDPFKRAAQHAGLQTTDELIRFGFTDVQESRGKSVYLIAMEDRYIALVEESLGTKILVADAMYELTGKLYYRQVAQCAVAMIVNDALTLGALPLAVTMFLAVGNSDWFNDETRYKDFITGWKHACQMAGCTWGGGETSVLKGIVAPGTAVIAGAAVGIIKPKERLIKGDIQNGDVIIMLESSGVHSNGLTLARSITERKPSLLRRSREWLVGPGKEPTGYLMPIEDGRTYGEALLDPTRIYVRFMEECLNTGVDIHYVVNITGHGWRKLMRARGSFRYVINRLPPVPSIFGFIQKHGPVSEREMYGTYNMGAGFALYVPAKEIGRVISIARKYSLDAWDCGYIQESVEREVVIKPENIVFRAAELGIR